MSSTPLVSVIMPAFKSEKYIGQAIESILAQTHTHLEILIFEDGSPDQTRAVINRYTDARIVKVLSDQNHGVVYARNALIDLAKGKYIELMDADDIADPTRLEKQVRVLSVRGPRLWKRGFLQGLQARHGIQHNGHVRSDQGAGRNGLSCGQTGPSGGPGIGGPGRPS